MKHFRSMVFLIIGFLVTASFAQESQLIMSDPANPIIITKATDHFTINLISNPSTGYNWHIKAYDPTVIEPKSQSYQAANTDKLGAPGSERFVFRVKREGVVAGRMTQIVMIYVRPWNMEIGQTKVFSIIFQ